MKRISLAIVAALAIVRPAAAQDFTMLVVSTSNHSVVRYDSAGNFLNTFVYPGAGGTFVPLEGIFAPDGTFLLSSRDSNSVLRFTSEGGFLGVFASPAGSGLDNPHGLEFGPDGHLYVASEVTHVVLKFHGQTGEFLGVFAGGMFIPTDLEFGPDGDLYVADANGIFRFDTETGAVLQHAALHEPRGLTFGPDGRLYVTDPPHGRIVRYSSLVESSAEVFVAAGTGGYAGGYSVRFGPDGHLYAPSGNRVLKFDGATGAFLGIAAPAAGSEAAGVLAGPTYIAFGPPPGESSQAQVSDLLAQNAALQTQIAGLHDQVNTLASEKAALQAENASLSQHLSGLIVQINACVQEKGVLQAQLAALTNEIAALASHNQALAHTLLGVPPTAPVVEVLRAETRAEIDAAIARVGLKHKDIREAERHYSAGVAAVQKGHFTQARRQFRAAFRLAHAAEPEKPRKH